MDVKLVVLGGRNAGQEISLPVERFRIGRATDCHLRPQSPQVEEHHCEIVIEPGAVRVLDLGSPLGTLVNGRRVQGAQVLKNGDRLSVGPLEFEVQLAVRVGGRKRPKVHSVSEAAARAAQAAAEKDFDPADWLAEEDEQACQGASADANAPSDAHPDAHPDAQTAGGTHPAGPAASPPGAKQGSRADAAAHKDQKQSDQNAAAGGKPGDQRPRFEVPAPENSASAAADMLRRYMQGKR